MSYEQQLVAMSDDDLAALDLATLDKPAQDAVLREASRRARHAEAEEARRADIALWRTRAYQLRWLAFGLVAAILAIAYLLTRG